MDQEDIDIDEILGQIKDLLKDSSNISAVSQILESLHAADIAEIIDDLDDEQRNIILKLVDQDEKPEVLEDISDSNKEEILEDISDDELAHIVDEMSPDVAVDTLEYVDDERLKLILQRIDIDLADDIRELREFPADTAGRIMTTEYLTVSKNMTVDQVIQAAKQYTEDTETLHHIIVTNEKNRLSGQVKMEDLIKADGNTVISELLDRAVISIHAERDQEVAARMMEKYDLAVLPVVGNGGKLLGIITFDDILEVMEEEASEDMFRMAGIGSANPFDEAIIKRAYKRLPWLITTLIGGAFLAVIIGKFQPTLKQIVALVSFIPVIAGLGGNVGIQSSTITVRGLATGDIDGLKDIFWLLPREIGVGSAIGIVTGTVLAVMANLFLGSINPELATNGGITDLMEFCGILGISVFCGIFCAAIVGTTAPLVCHRIGLDPAVAAGPFVTVSIDVITQTIYLGIATMLLL